MSDEISFKKDILTYVDFILSHQYDHSIEGGSLSDFPLCVYSKNRDGRYVSRNNFSAEKMVEQGFEMSMDVNSILNKKDYDLLDRQTADQFRENDILLMDNKTQNSMHFIEKCWLPSGEIISQLSIKKKSFNKSGEMIGVDGCSIDITTLLSGDLTMKKLLGKRKLVDGLKIQITHFMGNPSMLALSSILERLYHLAKHYDCPPELVFISVLSQRELQCLCLIARGSTSKEIGRLFNISNRTVEIYTQKIKEKLNCYSKSQLIDWFWCFLYKL